MKTIIIFTFLFVSIFSFSLKGQNSSRNHIEIETDPLAWAFGGGSLHGAYTLKNHRFQAGYAFLPVPDAFKANKGLEESFQALSLKWDIFWGKESAEKGFFTGITADHLWFAYENEEATTSRNHVGLGIRGGYKWNIFAQQPKVLSGWYLTPWVGLSYLTNAGDFELGNQTYTRPAFQVFPTVHLGYSF